VKRGGEREQIRCYVQLDGSHAQHSDCRCDQLSEIFCPIDAHAIRARQRELVPRRRRLAVPA
jgi:hypothetical protein